MTVSALLTKCTTLFLDSADTGQDDGHGTREPTTTVHRLRRLGLSIDLTVTHTAHTFRIEVTRDDRLHVLEGDTRHDHEELDLVAAWILISRPMLET